MTRVAGPRPCELCGHSSALHHKVAVQGFDTGACEVPGCDCRGF